MTALTSALHFFQALDRSLVSLGYSAEITTADFRGDSLYFAVDVSGSVFNDEDVHATAELTVKGVDDSYKAWVRDVAVDFYPYTKDELVREVNAALPNKIGGLPIRPVDAARVLASQFKKLGLEPAQSIEQVI